MTKQTEKKVTEVEFNQLRKDNPNIQMELQQASMVEWFFVKYHPTTGDVHQLIHFFKASF